VARNSRISARGGAMYAPGGGVGACPEQPGPIWRSRDSGRRASASFRDSKKTVGGFLELRRVSLLGGGGGTRVLRVTVRSGLEDFGSRG